MADSIADSKDLLLVILCSPGVQLDNSDYVLSADSPEDLPTEKGKTDPRLVPIAEVAEEMAASASNRRVLIVDGASNDDSALAKAAIRFGRSPIESRDGQWVILNQSNRTSIRGDQPAMTDFAWSFLDGVTLHADGNRDGSVTVFELSDYMKLWAEEHRMPPPRIAAKTSDDLPLLATSAAADPTFPRDELARNARRLLAEARKALRLEMDVRAAAALVDRARRLCDDADLKGEIDMVSATTEILKGNADKVLPLKASEGVTYEAALPKEAGVFLDGETKPSRKLPIGTVVQIAYRAPSSTDGANATFVRVVEALRLELKGDQVVSSPIPLPAESVWMLSSDLTATPGQTTPIASLREQFLNADQ
jgi:hypothetical protein